MRRAPARARSQCFGRIETDSQSTMRPTACHPACCTSSTTGPVTNFGSCDGGSGATFRASKAGHALESVLSGMALLVIDRTYEMCRLLRFFDRPAAADHVFLADLVDIEFAFFASARGRRQSNSVDFEKSVDAHHERTREANRAFSASQRSRLPRRRWRHERGAPGALFNAAGSLSEEVVDAPNLVRRRSAAAAAVRGAKRQERWLIDSNANPRARSRRAFRQRAAMQRSL